MSSADSFLNFIVVPFSRKPPENTQLFFYIFGCILRDDLSLLSKKNTAIARLPPNRLKTKCPVFQGLNAFRSIEQKSMARTHILRNINLLHNGSAGWTIGTLLLIHIARISTLPDFTCEVAGRPRPAKGPLSALSQPSRPHMRVSQKKGPFVRVSFWL